MECGCRLVVDHEVATELESPIGSPIAIAPTAICHGALALHRRDRKAGNDQPASSAAQHSTRAAPAGHSSRGCRSDRRPASRHRTEGGSQPRGVAIVRSHNKVKLGPPKQLVWADLAGANRARGLDKQEDLANARGRQHQSLSLASSSTPLRRTHRPTSTSGGRAARVRSI